MPDHDESGSAPSYTRPPPPIGARAIPTLDWCARFGVWALEQHRANVVDGAWWRGITALLAEIRQTLKQKFSERELEEARDILDKVQKAVQAGDQAAVRAKLGLGH